MTDRTLNILHAVNRKSAMQKTPMSVSDFFNRLGVSHPIPFTNTAYKALPKATMDDLKDVGGFICGESKNGRRRSGDVPTRSAAFLDVDNLPAGTTDAFIQAVSALGVRSCIYSTAKHSPEAPRLRVGIPFAEDIPADLYAPVVRLLCQMIQPQMSWFDPTCDEPTRIMFYPSHCSDVEPVYVVTDGLLLDAKELLASYLPNWQDVTTWPRFPRETDPKQKASKEIKAQNPTEKTGIIGAFCRAYDIPAAMAAFIPDAYEETTVNDRYTYRQGSTWGGAVVYENVFLYSHHATDPCGGRLVNAFDMVRLHLFGHLDADAKEETPVNRLPSTAEMKKLAASDPNVLLLMDQERQNMGRHEFDGLTEDNPDAWRLTLERDSSGGILPTIDNIRIILDNDPLLKGKFALNDFAGRGEVLGPLPWDSTGKRRMWSDTDNNGLYWYLEKHYKITKRGNIDSALDIHASQHRFNEVAEYLNGLSWDGIPRLDTVFIDYLGAEDNAYTRAVSRKAFTAAVARAMEPGTKFDYMPILCGPQGIGKSTLLDKMSRGWFNDSIRTFEGKEASELLQGVWLVEVAELDAFRRTDVSRIKQFLSLRADRYRAAYGRHVQELPRHCVFFGTSNQSDFLQDMTGNRRFWPVDVGIDQHPKTVWKDLTDDVISQIWAEAKTRWIIGELLYLTGDVEKYAEQIQEEHREENPNESLILEFAAQSVPVDWPKWDLQRRLDFWGGGIIGDVELATRMVLCPLEVWVELFHGSKTNHSNADIRQIRDALNHSPEWERCKNPVYIGIPYGNQRGYKRKNKP